MITPDRFTKTSIVQNSSKQVSFSGMNKAIFRKKKDIASNENDIKLFRKFFYLIKVDIVRFKIIFLINYVIKNQSCL